MVSGVRGFSTAIKDVSRLRAITGVLIKHGFGAVVTRLSLQDVIGVKSIMPYADADAIPYGRGQRIRMAIEELGPTFTKLGQILSTRSDLVPPDILVELQSLQDDVPELGFDEIRAQIEAELGASLEELFLTVDEEPLASASIAQVHVARLHEADAFDGDVVIKVQRPNLLSRIDSDLNILDFLARRAAQMIPELQLMDPVGIVHEFEKAIRKELDFTNERHNIGRFQVNFEGFEGLRVPRVIERLCTSKVLTMERMRGVKITHAPAELSIDPYTVAPRMLRALFKMVFQDGFFHGDLHPGNILIAEDTTIGLIDFGLVGRLTEHQRDHILDILIGISRNDYRLVSRVFFELGIKVPGVVYQYEAFEADVIEVMERHIMDKTLSEIDVGAFFADLVNGAIKHRIQMPPTYTMVFKALMTVEGIGKSLAPGINFIEEAQPFVREVLLERYSPRRLVKESVDLLGSMSQFLRVFPTTATHLLRDAERGEIGFKLSVYGLEKAVERHTQAQVRVARALAFAACMVAASLALTAPGPSSLGMSWISMILFAVGSVIGLSALRAIP